MNNYIINPWFFYFVDICSELDFVLTIVGVLLFAVAIVAFAALCFDGAFINPDDEDKRHISISKKLMIAGIILSILALICPKEDTLIKMQVAKFGTYDNAEKVLDVIDEKTDALINALDNKED